MRLHTAAAVQEKLANDAHLIVAGDPAKSELYERLVLPVKNKKRMPKGADPLAQESLALISTWIQEGASFGAVAKDAQPAAASNTTAPPVASTYVLVPKQEAVPLPEVEAATQEAIDQLVSAGAQVLPLFAECNLLDVSFALAAEPADDEDLAQLAEVAPQIYSLNLRGAKATDEGWAKLAKLKNLAHLKLDGSSFSDPSAIHLAGLERLESLNLYGTQVTDSALASLAGLKHLSKIYLWKTGVTYESAEALEKTHPGIQWNLGWDHPVVVRKRLDQQKGEFAELVKNAEADTALEQKELEVAKTAEAAAKKRLEDLESELKTLSEGAGGTKPAEKPESPK